MSNLPALSSYEASALDEASQLSAAFRQYAQQPAPAETENKIRYNRNQLWLRAAIASLQGFAAQEVCQFWSECADQLLTEAFQASFKSEKIALFALGKLGSHELNLSSDVDILLLCEDDSVPATSGLRQFQKILAERTSFGFVFRVDFDLRPGGRNGPLIPTVEQFKDYYGNYGETWERLAFVRLRFICGDSQIKKDVDAFANKFTFRKHLDFTLLDDLKNLRKKIHAHYWERTQAQQIDLKLGIGGIRDIELFVHALQVVHGGKDPQLQLKSTHEALKKIAEKKLLPTEEALFLQRHYWNLRALENYVQALQDEQTHLLKLSDSHPPFIHKLLHHLSGDMERCSQIVSELLGAAPLLVAENQELTQLLVTDETIREYWNEVLGHEVLSRSKERDEAARKSFLEAFVLSLQAQGGNLPRGILLLKDFVKATKAKATFFSMLIREKNLLQELSWLFGHSPYLARILCHRPELLDSFVYRSQDAPSQDWSILLEELSERKLLSEIINGTSFSKTKNIQHLIQNLTSTADSIVADLLHRLKQDFPSEVKILALGKWGGKELGFKSDLDFIFVVPFETKDVDFKLIKRFLSRLSEPHKGGAIYEIDMRLRPSGKAGPLIINEADLEKYLLEEASAWERQAYLKSRWISGEGPAVKKLALQKNLSAEELSELNRIRKALLTAPEKLDLKYSEGGLIDLEFAAQVICLQQKMEPQNSNTLSFFKAFGKDEDLLTANYLRLRQTEQMLQLVASESLTEVTQNHESFPFLAGALQADPLDLIQQLKSILAENLQILNALDPRRGTQ